MKSEFFNDYSKQRQQETVSQTGKRSQYSSAQGSTPFQTADNSNSYSFDINIQNLMPLIESLKEQNEQLRHEREDIQKEMEKLKVISEQMLAENSQMRAHYQQRTEDIKKVVHTISMNMNEETEDLNHMIHMTKTHNYTIVKEIEQSKAEIEERSRRAVELEEQLGSLQESNSLLEEELITRKVKIQQLEQRLNELKARQRSGDVLFELEEEVDELLLDTQKLRSANYGKLRSAEAIQNSNESQKPHLMAENINVIQNIKALKLEIKQMQEDSQSFQNNIEELQRIKQKVQEKCYQGNSEREKNKILQEEKEDEIKRLKQAIIHRKNCKKETENKKSELEDEKYYLEKELRKRKEKIEKLKEKAYSEKQNTQSEYQKQLRKLRTEHNLNVEKSNDEIVYKLNPEMNKRAEDLEAVKDEYEMLTEEVRKMRQTVDGMHNPVKEIMRAEYDLKKLAYKR